MGIKLIEGFNTYNEILNNTLSCKKFSVFNVLRSQFKEESFEYELPAPRYIAPNLQPVPTESWLENFVKRKKENRLNIIESNRILEETATQEYEAALIKYQEAKETAYANWRNEFEQNIVEEENAYMAGDLDALNDYLDALMTISGFTQDLVETYEFGYQPSLKRLVLEMHIQNRDDIFYAEGYRYIKQRDEFSPIKMKVSEANNRLRNLMIELAISAIVVILNNDDSSSINDIVVNIYHNNICCISAYIEKVTLEKYDLTNRNQKTAFIARQMKIFKTLNTGVKAFEYIYGNE